MDKQEFERIEHYAHLGLEQLMPIFEEIAEQEEIDFLSSVALSVGVEIMALALSPHQEKDIASVLSMSMEFVKKRIKEMNATFESQKIINRAKRK